MRYTRQLLYSHETQKLELLMTPLNRLGLRLRGSPWEESIRTMRGDMERVRLTALAPNFYLSTGYGCVAGTANISLGFYDGNEMLQDLNEEYRGWRYSDRDILNLLRHELGHAFCYTYKLYRTARFRELFNVAGNFFLTYPDNPGGGRFSPNPWSRDFVNPCGDHYAQSHPDEDFAETFCVFLDPQTRWRRRFRTRPGALRKLEYVAEQVWELGRRPPQVENDPDALDEPLDTVKDTLAHFLRARPVRYRRRATGYVDDDLRALFRHPPRGLTARTRQRHYQRAADFLREQRRVLVARIGYWTGADEVVVTDLIDKCVARSRALDLWLKLDDGDKKLVEVTSYLTVLTRNFQEHDKYLIK
jgi:hypothetical protein